MKTICSAFAAILALVGAAPGSSPTPAPALSAAATTFSPAPKSFKGPDALDRAIPTVVAKAFIASLQSTDPSTAWRLMTRRTRSEIIASVVSYDPSLSPADAEAAFDAGDPRMDRQFWAGTRKGGAKWFETFKKARYKEHIYRNRAWVYLRAGRVASPLFLYKEDGAWKVGFVETFFPKGLGRKT